MAIAHSTVNGEIADQTALQTASWGIVSPGRLDAVFIDGRRLNRDGLDLALAKRETGRFANLAGLNPNQDGPHHSANSVTRRSPMTASKPIVSLLDFTT